MKADDPVTQPEQLKTYTNFVSYIQHFLSHHTPKAPQLFHYFFRQRGKKAMIHSTNLFQEVSRLISFALYTFSLLYLIFKSCSSTIFHFYKKRENIPIKIQCYYITHYYSIYYYIPRLLRVVISFPVVFCSLRDRCGQLRLPEIKQLKLEK